MMNPELHIAGEGGRRTVSLAGRVAGHGLMYADGWWEFEIRIPGGAQHVCTGGPDLETAWVRVLQNAGPELVLMRGRLERLEAWRERVIEQAGADGWMALAVSEDVAPDGVLRIPRVPFIRWALREANRHLWPAWTNVCPAGVKLRGDDVNHTDWIVGAGLDPAVFYEAYSRGDTPAARLNRAAYQAMSRVQAELLRFECAVLSGTGRVTGRVWHADRNLGQVPPDDRVVILPDASTRWTDLIMAACAAKQAVIVEVGGAGAHLASLGREREVRMVRVDTARHLYPEPWTKVTVDCDRGQVDINMS